MIKLVLLAEISPDGFAGDIHGCIGFLPYNEQLRQCTEKKLLKTVGAAVYQKCLLFKRLPAVCF